MEKQTCERGGKIPVVAIAISSWLSVDLLKTVMEHPVARVFLYAHFDDEDTVHLRMWLQNFYQASAHFLNMFHGR